MTNSNETPKRITVYLTNRNPVSITNEEWPVLARGTGDSYCVGNYDGARYEQARCNGEIDEYKLIVRQHADGRTLVYGILDAASAWTGNESVRGGVLLESRPSNNALFATIDEVGHELGLPERVIRDCFEGFKPEEL